MINDNLNRGLVFNTLWSFLGRFGYLSIALISNIILVRLLSPEEFGKASIVLFFVVMSNILTESGLSGALVRKQDTTAIDYSTVFIFNLGISAVLMFCLYISAEYIAEFYNDISLIPLIKLSSLILLINAFRITQYVRLLKELRFKAKSLYEVISIIIGSIIAILFALNGAGASALIWLQICSALTLTLILWISVGPLSSFKFSKDSFKEVYKFGINTTLASLINKAFDNSYQLILAKYFALSQSGYFYQAKKLQEMPVSIIQSSVSGVVFATLSRLQDSPDEFNKLYINIVRVLTLAIGILCLLIFFYAELIVNILYGPEWLISASYLKLLIVASFFSLQEFFNRILFKIFNRTDIILKLEIAKKVLLSTTIIYGISTLSIKNLLYGFILVSIISFLINYFIARIVYRGNEWSELKIILKVVVSLVLTLIINIYLMKHYEIYELYSLFLLPSILGIYLAINHFFKVIHLKKDILNILKLIK